MNEPEIGCRWRPDGRMRSQARPRGAPPRPGRERVDLRDVAGVSIFDLSRFMDRLNSRGAAGSSVRQAPRTSRLRANRDRSARRHYDRSKRAPTRGMRSGRLLRRSTEGRRPGRDEGAIQFEDEDGPRTVILTDRVPDAGYEQPAGGELPETGYFVWDDETSSWRAY